MNSMWLLATLLLPILPQSADTTFAVPANARLHVENHRGDIVVDTWSRNAVRVRSEQDLRGGVRIRTVGAVVYVEAESRRGHPGGVDYRITVPARMALELIGVNTDISVTGSEGEIRAESVQGDVEVRGGRGFVSVRSVQGSIQLRDARGRIEAASVNEDVTLRNVEGDVRAETVNGEIRLERVQSNNVEASTVNGDVDYDGAIRDNGRYRFASHNGDVTVTVAERANVTVAVSTFQGNFNASFPVRLGDVRSTRQFSFVLGSGSARLELESFQGTLRLRRPGEARRS